MTFFLYAEWSSWFVSVWFLHTVSTAQRCQRRKRQAFLIKWMVSGWIDRLLLQYIGKSLRFLFRILTKINNFVVTLIKGMRTFRRLMNRTHSTQVVRNGSKHTAQLPNRDSILCISGESRDAPDATDGFFRMNLAACSCAENKLISCQSTHLLQFEIWLLPPVSSYSFQRVSINLCLC